MGVIVDATIDQQTLRYDEAAFQQRVAITTGQQVSNQVTTHPTDWWEYDAEVGAAGIVLRDVHLQTVMDHGSGPHPMIQPVAKWIEFHDLEVTIGEWTGMAGEEILAIDLADAVETDAEQGWEPLGVVPGEHPEGAYQEGVHYIASVPCRGSTAAHSAVVEIHLACTFRGPAADFDPPKAIVALQCFPQIAFRQRTDLAALGLDPADFQGIVSSFDGTVRIVADVHTPANMRAAMLAELFDSPDPTQAASFPTGVVSHAALFTDMYNLHAAALIPEFQVLIQELWPDLMSLRHLFNPIGLSLAMTNARDRASAEALRLAQAQWIAFFEFVERVSPRMLDGDGARPAAVAKEVQVAGQAGDPRIDVYREDTVRLSWSTLPDGGLFRIVRKERRQGGYDNMHLHGTMGTVGDIASTDPLATPRVMAPGCGHSCFHCHWRWGNTTYFLTAADPLHPDVGLLQLLASAGLHDAILQSIDEQADEDAAAALADVLWNAGPDWLMPPTAPQFKGWSNAGVRSRRYQVVGGTLTPPNQGLVLAVGPEPAGEGAAFVASALDDDVKAVELRFSVDCTPPWSPTWLHCTTEFGIGVAVRYAPSAAETLFRLLCVTYYKDLNYLPQWMLDLVVARFELPPAQSHSVNRVFTRGYDIIPFVDSTNPRALVHATNAGTDTTVTAGVALEDL